MVRTIIALALAATIFGASILCALLFETWIGRAIALWPGIAVQRLLKLVGISFADKGVFLSTLLFWWLAVWLMLRFWLSRTPEFLNRTALTCPFCKHQFPLTWRRYWKNLSGRHVCPSCGQSSKVRTGWPYWVVYLPLLLISPFAVMSFASGIYGIVVPRHHFAEGVTWFLGSPWFVAILIALWALLFPIDRVFDVRLRGLQAPKHGERAV